MEKLFDQESKIALKNLPHEILHAIEKAADKAGVARLALVGGAVRDCLMNSKGIKTSQKILDLDFLVEGSAITLGRKLLNDLDPIRVKDYQVHQKFKTVELKIDNFPIDLASSRQEIYERAGYNPIVSSASLEEDLSRRDFSINAIALDLVKLKLIDPHNGLAAIKKKELIFLHQKSVEDDPTRIIRGARYSSRIGFKLESNSLSQIQSTLREWPWDWKHGDPPELAPPSLGTRLKMELDLLLNKEDWKLSLTLMQQWGALVLLEDSLQSDTRIQRRLNWAIRFKLPLLPALISSTKDPIDLAKRLHIPIHQVNLIKQFLSLKKLLLKVELNQETKDFKPIDWCKILEKPFWNKDAIALAICVGIPSWRYLLKWYLNWRHIKSPISAKDLLQKGWEQGPDLGEKLTQLRYSEIKRLTK